MNSPDLAYVVFTDQTDLWWLRFLRRGFRHCFVILCVGEVRICLDPLAYRLDVLCLSSDELETLLVRLGEREDVVVEVAMADVVLPPQVLSVFSCVGLVKRLLGLRCPFVLTPWQLYQFLQSYNKRSLSHG